MTARYVWDDLPRAVRRGVESVVGTVVGAESPDTSCHTSPFVAAPATAEGGRAFAKGAPIGDTDAAEGLRREAVVSPIVGRFAATLLGEIAVDGWRVLVFEYVDGAHLDLSPGSDELGVLAETLEDVQTIDPPFGVELPTLAERWEKYLTGDERSLLVGDALLHTDLVPENLLIRYAGYGRRLYLLDWGRAAIGPAWAEYAGLYDRLLVRGHTPESARAWLNRFPVWRHAGRAALCAFVAARQRQEIDLMGDKAAAPGVARWATLLDE
ncbi:phosphotransferase family protein [Embleya sp. NPDC020630]|uniref:phosphotransferase family protein n=1 Tax=Embleya sp. NPDC020630 TaxID=3363979 RepID=UPI0037A3E70B